MKYALFAAAALIFAGNASASESGWITNEFNHSVDIKGSATEDYEYSGVITRTADPNAPEIRLSCSERNGLRVTLETLPAVERENISASRAKPTGKTSLLSIDGREPVRTQWILIRKTQTLQARKNAPAAMIYNAIATGAGFDVDMPFGRGTVRFDPPAIDEQFKAFASKCHKTNGS